MEKFANAVKALIVHENDLLLLKNSLSDPHRPGEFDIPGGRLELGEDPYTGLKRELAEELGKEFADAVVIGRPIDVNHFDRPDGQTVTMMLFECKLKAFPEIKLSDEHHSFEWLSLGRVEHTLADAKNVDVIRRAFRRLISY